MAREAGKKSELESLEERERSGEMMMGEMIATCQAALKAIQAELAVKVIKIRIHAVLTLIHAV